MADSTSKKKFSAFFFLNATQFLGALNDNLYKLLLVFFLIDLEGISHSPTILALAGGIFVLPFLLFSIPSGTLADRMSKQRIIIFTKFFELATVIVGIIGFALRSPLLVYTGLFLLATESAIFGPSKYGIIPEIVPRERISKANSLLSSFTFLAIIVGTFLGSSLTELTDRNFVLASLCCLLIALAGIVACLNIPKTPAAGSTKKITPFFLKEIIPTLKKAKQVDHLVLAMVGSSFFLMIGAFTQLNIIPYAVNCLGMSDVEGGYLFLVTALGIGGGSLLAGRISGNFIELGLVPIGALGMSVCFLVLGYCVGEVVPTVITVFFIGAFGGLYLVPCDSFIQYASPNDTRGQNVATNNFGGFLGVLFASALIYLLSSVLGLSACKGFIVMGFLTLFMTSIVLLCLPEAVLHLFAFLKFRPKSFKGEEAIPQNGGALLLAPNWKTAFAAFAYRKRPIFLAVCFAEKKPFIETLLRFIRIIPLSSNAGLNQLQLNLQKGKVYCLVSATPAMARAFLEQAKTSQITVVTIKKEPSKNAPVEFISSL